jgi:hypothetical protein
MAVTNRLEKTGLQARILNTMGAIYLGDGHTLMYKQGCSTARSSVCAYTIQLAAQT